MVEIKNKVTLLTKKILFLLGIIKNSTKSPQYDQQVKVDKIYVFFLALFRLEFSNSNGGGEQT